MRIFVAVKCVPDTATKVQVGDASSGDPVGRTIRTDGVKFVISPYDEMALEQAVRLKEASDDFEVIAVSLGGDRVQPVLRSALALGADSAVHLEAEAPTGLELDGFQIAHALADFLRGQSFDLLLFGRLAVDDQSSQVGSLTAGLLGIPSVADVIKMEVETGKARFHHHHDGKVEVVECSLPAAATAQKGLAEARYPSMKAIMASKKKPIETLAATLQEPVLEPVKLEMPPAREPGKIVGEGVAAVAELVRLLREEARVL